TSRLMRVDLVSGRAEEVTVHSVRDLEPTLLTVGDELIAIGTSPKDLGEQCAIAIRPSMGVERTVVCGIRSPAIEPADGGVLIRLPDNSPNGCSVRLLVPGRDEFGLPVYIGYCHQRQIIPLDGWQAYYLDGPEPAQPLLANDETDRVMLGMTKAPAAACHGRLYWVSGGSDDSQFGVEVLRWTPGAREVEVIYRSQDGTGLGWPTCTQGTLTVTVHSSTAVGSPMPSMLMLDQP